MPEEDDRRFQIPRNESERAREARLKYADLLVRIDGGGANVIRPRRPLRTCCEASSTSKEATREAWLRLDVGPAVFVPAGWTHDRARGRTNGVPDGCGGCEAPRPTNRCRTSDTTKDGEASARVERPRTWCALPRSKGRKGVTAEKRWG